MLEANHISVSYGKHLAVNDVSISVASGECVVILGANGAGKSSLLRGITGMVPIGGTGIITYQGQNITKLAAHKIVDVGVAHVPEGRGLFGEMSVEENLVLGSHPRRAREGLEEKRQEVLWLFPKLFERRSQIVGTMSGGEQQMVAIARALMSKPDLLILDEPSLGLAPIVVGELFHALKNIREKGISLLIVEQNVRVSLSIAHKGYLLEAGKIVGEESAKNLLNDPAVKQAFLGH
jgi:branched-chain amino acid transport system ATP-binding protein